MPKSGLGLGRNGKPPPIEHRFKPGNPGGPGRPKAEFTKAECERLAREHGPQMVEVLAGIAHTAKSEMVRVVAADKVLDRAVGKPVQAVDAAVAVKPDGEDMQAFRALLDKLSGAAE